MGLTFILFGLCKCMTKLDKHGTLAFLTWLFIRLTL